MSRILLMLALASCTAGNDFSPYNQPPPVAPTDPPDTGEADAGAGQRVALPEPGRATLLY